MLRGYLNILVTIKILVLILISFIFIYKLDYPYFFTDEILYTHAGQEYIHGIYNDNLQHPLIGKYIVGFISLISSNNVFILRLPYAVLGILSSIIVYLIIKDFYGDVWAILGSLLYALSPFIYESTRMVMFEAPLYFFWLLFHLFFLRHLKYGNKNNLLVSGITLGLAIATKIPSVLLYVFSFIIYVCFIYVSKNSSVTKKLYSFISLKDMKVVLKANQLIFIYIVSFLIYILTYSHLLFTSGWTTLLEVAKETLKIFIGRNTDGKQHVIDNIVYNNSPWWTYLYYIVNSYSLPALLISSFSAFIYFLRRNFYTFYWTLFLVLNIIFFQLIPLKNARYISGIEFSLVFLTIALFYYIHMELKIKPLKYLSFVLFTLLISFRVYGVVTQTKTEYNWVFNYFKDQTNNFTIHKRMYVLGSIRSLKWYRDLLPNEDMFLYRRDYDVTCGEFVNFDYIVFEHEELLMDPTNMLFEFVQSNVNGFEKISIPNFTIYKKIDNYIAKNICVNN